MTFFSRVAFAALWLFVLTVPVEKAVMLQGFGSVAKLTGFVAVAIGAFVVLMERRVRIPVAFHVLFAALTVWGGLSIYWTMAHDMPNGIDFTYYRLNTYSQLLAMCILIWQFAPTEKRVHSLMRAYVLGALIPFFVTLRNFMSGQMTYYQRYSLDNTEPNDMALVLALSLPMSYYLFLRSKSPLRFLYLVQMLAACGTILMTVSRGGTLASVVALSLMFWARKRLQLRWRVALLAVAGAAVIAAIALVPATTWARLATTGSEVSSGTMTGRTLIWREGWRNFERSPFLGIGLGAYPDSVASFFGVSISGNFTPVAHNTFYSYLVETGMIGFTIFACLFGVVVRSALKMSGLAKMLWLTMLLTWIVGVNALTWDDRKPTWLLFSLIVCHHAALRSEQQRKSFALNPLQYWQEAVA